MTEPYTVLHGGFHKTASTFLQKSLQRNKGKLAKSGVHYVPHRHMRKQYTVPCQQNAYQAIGIRRRTVVEDAQLRQIASDFFEPVTSDPPQRLVLSDENLAGHCGNCVKTGQLYRYRDPFVASFARNIPYPVREVYLAVRSYADFFAGAYVEYFRSLQEDSSHVTTSRMMCTRVFNHMPGWNGAISVIIKRFPDARIFVWQFEDFIKHKDMAPMLLQKLVGDSVDVQTFKAPQGDSQRESASGRAMEQLELMALVDGLPDMVAARQKVQNRFPRNKENGRFDPWHPWERAHLDRLYIKDIARLRTNSAVTLLDPSVMKR
ncbi:hypothetical protein MWU60_02820 [Yoonia sp. F2084L]|uniref:hypothetical protein n=1 Tax=Yoonia sp. F2084L TaxID=2926419 RepID=UPI001FF61FAF|nr:hypothetical protein [Yoonia sp. F2084L]MCK0094492.1 hypothetical protein [Yoonia sp. F2084L]